MKKLERQLHMASIASQSSVTASEASRSPVVSKSPALSRVNGLTESLSHRTSSSPLKPSSSHLSDSSLKMFSESGMLALPVQ